MANGRRGVVLSGLMQTIDFSALDPAFDPDNSVFPRERLPRDANTEKLFHLWENGSINQIVEELDRLEAVYPGKYSLPVGVQAAPLRSRDIRRYLTLWDVIDYPVIEGWGSPLSKPDPDLDLLVEQKFIVRSRITGVYSESGLHSSVKTHRAAFAARDAVEPGCWSMARDAHSLLLNRAEEVREDEQGRGALVRLYGCIPIPESEVSIHQVLEFKSSRRDELLALRYHLEAIYQRISAAGDRSLSLDAETSQLEKSLADYLKAGRDTRLQFSLLDLTCQIKLQFDLRSGIAAGALTYASNLPAYAVILAGIAGSAFPKLEISTASAPRTAKVSSNPFEYVTSLRTERF